MPNSRHSPAIFSPSSSRATNLRRSSIGLHSFQGILALPQKARLCNPCLRNELSPLSQEGHFATLHPTSPAVAADLNKPTIQGHFFHCSPSFAVGGRRPHVLAGPALSLSLDWS